MITEEEYKLGQQILGHTLRPQPKSHMFAYTALMTCGECGSAITAEEKWQIICGACKTKFASQNRERCPTCHIKIANLTNKKILHYVYYHCTKRKGLCSQKGIRVADLEAQIDRFLMRFNLGEKYMRWALDTLRDEIQDDLGERKQSDTTLTRERTRIKNELIELKRFIIKQENDGWTLMSKEDALAEKERLMAELRNIEKGQADNNQRASESFDSAIQAFEYACRARFWLKEGTIEQKREICAALGSNLTLMDRILTLNLAYPLPEIANMVEIAPDIAAWFEPKTLVGITKDAGRFEKEIPTLLRSLNAIRNYFISGNTFQAPAFVSAKPNSPVV